jgi:GDP-4-dehydro-6-deoxy-D-mannose reductase
MLNMLLAAAGGPKRIIALDKGVHHSAVPSLRIETVICDLTDRPGVLKAIEQAKPDGIIHLAGMTTGSDLSSYFAVNVQACEHVLAAAARLKRQPRILVVGSAAEYGISSGTHELVDEQRPLRAKTAYGISKIMQENWALLYHHEKSLPVICVRPFNIIGPGQSVNLVPAAFLCQIAEVLRGTAQEVCVGDISTQRDFIDVRDVVDALWALMNAGPEADGQIFNISSGQPLKIADMLEACIKLSGRHISVCRDQSRLKAHDVPVIVGDNTKLKQCTGWQCRIPWRDSLATMWNCIISDSEKGQLYQK